MYPRERWDSVRLIRGALGVEGTTFSATVLASSELRANPRDAGPRQKVWARRGAWSASGRSFIYNVVSP